MKVADNVGVGVLGNLPVIRLQFGINAFGMSPMSVVADVGLDYATAENLARMLTDAMAQVRQAQALAEAPQGRAN